MFLLVSENWNTSSLWILDLFAKYSLQYEFTNGKISGFEDKSQVDIDHNTFNEYILFV